MRRYARVLILTGATLWLGLAALANGQNADPGGAVEARLLRLEQAIATLDTQLQLRTNVATTDSLDNRAIELNARLDRVELSVEQLERRFTDLERQVVSAQRAADQAQREAQAAQRIARSAEARSR